MVDANKNGGAAAGAAAVSPSVSIFPSRRAAPVNKKRDSTHFDGNVSIITTAAAAAAAPIYISAPATPQTHNISNSKSVISAVSLQAPVVVTAPAADRLLHVHAVNATASYPRHRHQQQVIPAEDLTGNCNQFCFDRPSLTSLVSGGGDSDKQQPPLGHHWLKNELSVKKDAADEVEKHKKIQQRRLYDEWKTELLCRKK